jgi:hypothetical protein
MESRTLREVGGKFKTCYDEHGLKLPPTIL